MRLLTNASGFAVDLLISHGVVSELHFAYVSLDADGLAPAFRRACEQGGLPLVELDSPVILAALRAGACGLPWIPLTYNGNDIRDLSPNYFADVDLGSPGLVAVRAVNPDVVFLHAAYADSAGNLYYRDSPIADYMFATAARHVIATVEEIRPDEAVVPAEGRIPAFLVDGILEGPGLARPGAVPGYYDTDHDAVRSYVAGVRGGR